MNSQKRTPVATAIPCPATAFGNERLAKMQLTAPNPSQSEPRALNGHINGGKRLRFAALVRVSTEQQEKTGESLATQRNQNERSVAHLGGVIVAWYGGQEHATPGYEKNEIDRLVTDSQKNLFDAVIVTDPDRWSRDNVSSQHGLDSFKRNEIKFFTGTQERDLFNQNDMLFLGMSAVIGRYFAANQKRKSIENRINRAKRGIPTGGKLPYGRIFERTENRQDGKWKIDTEKQRLIKDAAKRYLAGGAIVDLAAEYGMNASNLHKILVKVSGSVWQLEFDSDELNIHETVPMTIPPLLDENTIVAIHAKIEANRTFTHGHIKHRYLFARMISCAHCGYAMFGQTNHNGKRYYRHAHAARDRECPGAIKKAWISADVIENAVMRHLFEMFGNPSAVQKAIQKATPDSEKMRELVGRQNSIADDLKKIEQARTRILDLVEKDVISEKDAFKKLTELKEREAKLNEERARLIDELAHVPSSEDVRKFSQEIGGRILQYTNATLQAKIMHLNEVFEEMPYDEKRELCQKVFGGKTVEGKRMGVWMSWGDDGKKWKHRVEGHLINEAEPDWDEVIAKRKVKKAPVSKNANY
jgi:DNA invertase Pin-like site-specific DNA recombinase